MTEAIRSVFDIEELLRSVDRNNLADKQRVVSNLSLLHNSAFKGCNCFLNRDGILVYLPWCIGESRCRYLVVVLTSGVGTNPVRFCLNVL